MKTNKKGTGYIFFVIFILLFSLFYRPIDGDFWHYYDIYQIGTDAPYRHMEPFYYWLMDLVPNNYLLWRVCIWLPAAIIIAVFLRRLNIPASIATTFFLMLALTFSYYYPRNILGLSILYLTMTLIAQRKSKIRGFWYICILLLAVASWYLHKAMPIYILFALIAILLPFNKRYFLWALFAFPLLYGIMTLLTSQILSLYGTSIDESISINYLDVSNTFYVNWKGAIDLLIQFFPMIYFYYVAFRNFLPPSHPDFRAYKVFLLFSFFIFYLSFLFLGQSSASIQGRLYASSMLPFSVVVCLYFKNNLYTKECRNFIYLMFFSYAWQLLLITIKSV